MQIYESKLSTLSGVQVWIGLGFLFSRESWLLNKTDLKLFLWEKKKNI